jgi:hypothetical protein
MKETAAGRSPAALAHEAIHDSVVAILANLPRGALLDVPAGEGALAARLIEAGFDVRCCDLYPEIFRLDGVAIHQGNLDGELPFADPFVRLCDLSGRPEHRDPRRCASSRASQTGRSFDSQRAEHFEY